MGNIELRTIVFHSKIFSIVTSDLALHRPQKRTMDSVRIAPQHLREAASRR